jgi:D-apiose dehydrogenase
MRIALVGLGAAASQIHIPAIRSVETLQLVGGCDIRLPTRHYDFPVHTSVDGMLLQCRPDIVVIGTPTEFHFSIAAQVLSAGTHVFCEKPFTSTLNEALQLLEIAKANGVQIGVNNEFRFMDCHRAAKAVIGTPKFGALTFVSMQQAFRTTQLTEAGWRGADKERTCKDFGIHVFDLCRYFFGEEPLRLRAVMPRPGALDGPDLLNLIDLEFSGDRYARITLDRLTRGRHRYLDIRLDGERASIETELGGNATIAAGLHPSTRRPFVEFDVSFGGRAYLYIGEQKTKIASDPLNLFAAATAKLLREYVKALQEGAAVPCAGIDNIRTLALMRAAYQSAATKTEIDLAFLNALGKP